MPEIALDGVSLMDLTKLAGITEGKGSAAQKVAAVRLYLMRRDIKWALANKEVEGTEV